MSLLEEPVFEYSLEYKNSDYKVIDMNSEIGVIDKEGNVHYCDKNGFLKITNIKFLFKDKMSDRLVLTKNFDFTKITWEPNEFVKSILVGSDEGFLDKKGFITIVLPETEIGDVSRIFYKDLMKTLPEDELLLEEGLIMKACELEFIYPLVSTYYPNMERQQLKEYILTLFNRKSFVDIVLGRSVQFKRNFYVNFLTILSQYMNKNASNDEDDIYIIIADIMNQNMSPQINDLFKNDIFNSHVLVSTLMKNVVETYTNLINNFLKTCLPILSIRPKLIKKVRNANIVLVNKAFFRTLDQTKNTFEKDC